MTEAILGVLGALFLGLFIALIFDWLLDRL